jgi:hypothetical protein
MPLSKFLDSILASVAAQCIAPRKITGVNASHRLELRNSRPYLLEIGLTTAAWQPFGATPVPLGTPAVISERSAASDGHRAEPPSRPPRA